MRSSEMFLELWLLRYRAKGRNEQNVIGENTEYGERIQNAGEKYRV
jgi:hypothetical protein